MKLRALGRRSAGATIHRLWHFGDRQAKTRSSRPRRELILESLEQRLVLDAGLPPEVATLQLVSDTGESATDGITTNPSVTGSVTNDGPLDGLQVEFDHDGDGVAEGTEMVGTDGSFTYSPFGLSPGPVTIQARAKEWDDVLSECIHGAWVPLTFTLELQRPSVTSLGLANDTGSFSDDGVTSDPTLTGQVSDDGYLDSLEVQFDHDGDGVADGSTLTTLDGSFSYAPAGLPFGPVTVRARAGEWDPGLGEVAYGDWASFSFTLEPAVPPQVQTLQLVNDDGATNSDLVTSDPLLFGLVTNDGPVGGLEVEFDHDGDGVAEGTSVTGSEGAFTYQPTGITPGPVTIYARASEWDVATQAFIAGVWTAFSFTYEQPSLAAPTVNELRLSNDTGESGSDGVTTNPSLSGSVVYAGDVFGITIEFDHNGDGAVEGTTTTDYQGRFSYSPVGLPAGPVTISGRAGVWDLIVDEQRFGDWTSVSFTLADQAGDDQGPRVEGFD